jgi:hypothetical protein
MKKEKKAEDEENAPHPHPPHKKQNADVPAGRNRKGGQEQKAKGKAEGRK